MDATVWITTYKATDYLRLAYESVPRGVRLAILDDGGGLSREGFPDAELFAHETNKGVTAAWNTALRFSERDKPVVICNDDIVFSRDSLRLMLDALDPDVGIVGPVTNQPGADPEQALQRWASFDNYDDYRRTEEYAAGIKGEAKRTRRVNGFCFALNPLALDAIGWEFNSANKHWGNEKEIQIRLHRAGFASVVAPAFVFHFKHVTMRRENIGKKWRKANFPRM